MNSIRSAKLAEVLFLLTVLPATAMAWKTPPGSASCSGAHRAGDLITCYVRFADKADFKDLQVVFNLPREDKPRKHGTQINFVLRDTRKIGPRTYSVSGALPDCVPGTYILAAIVARNSARYQQYMNLPEIQISVEDDSGDGAALASTNEALNIGETSASARSVPHVVETPPTDASMFPAITGITPAPVAAAPVVDLVTWFARFLRKPDSCGGKHKQGETVTCRIQFRGDPHFQMVGLSFMRDESRTTFSQSQQCRGFGAGIAPDSPPLAAGLYEVSAEIPMCGSGKYKIAGVTAFGSSNGNKTIYAKTYGNGSDFKSAIVLKVKDVSHHEFPAVVAVGNSAD